MINKPITARDLFHDPAGWAGSPQGFAEPNEDYLLSRLASVVAKGNFVEIYYWTGETLRSTSHQVQDSIEADRIVARFQPRIGDLLLEALNTDIREKPE